MSVTNDEGICYDNVDKRIFSASEMRSSNFFIKITRLILGCFGGTILIYLLWLPYVPRLKQNNPTTTALIERRKNRAEKTGKKFEPRMYWKKTSEISPHLVHAVILAEDDTFYQHRGFDFEQIKIAAKINWKKKRFAYGGSTITQQLARTLYLSPSKNLLRKLKEAIITFWMEMTLPKKRILELYLNVVEWGDGIYGTEAAAQHYYHKSSAELTPEESVALASILPSPRKWSPFRETPFMRYRRSNILSRMKIGDRKVPETEIEKEEDRLKLSDEIGENHEETEKDFEGKISSPAVEIQKSQ